MSPLGARLFSLVFIVIGGAILFFGIKSLINANASKTWPTVQGRVVSSSVESKSGDKGGITYHAEVLYEFTVAGKIHSCSHVAFGDYGSSDPSHARSIVNKYSSGSSVTVYYSPTNPDTCVIEPGVSGKAFVFPGAGCLFFAAGMVVFVFVPRAIQKQRSLLAGQHTAQELA